MQLDNILSTITNKVAKETETDPEQVVKVIDALFRGIGDTIHEKKSEVIKIPYFGKFIYSEDYKKKKDQIFGRIVDFKEIQL